MSVSQVVSRVKSDVRSLVTTVLLGVILYAFGVVDEILRWLCAKALTEYLETRVRIGSLSVWVVRGGCRREWRRRRRRRGARRRERDAWSSRSAGW